MMSDNTLLDDIAAREVLVVTRSIEARAAMILTSIVTGVEAEFDSLDKSGSRFKIVKQTKEYKVPRDSLPRDIVAIVKELIKDDIIDFRITKVCYEGILPWSIPINSGHRAELNKKGITGLSGLSK